MIERKNGISRSQLWLASGARLISRCDRFLEKVIRMLTLEQLRSIFDLQVWIHRLHQVRYIEPLDSIPHKSIPRLIPPRPKNRCVGRQEYGFASQIYLGQSLRSSQYYLAHRAHEPSALPTSFFMTSLFGEIYSCATNIISSPPTCRPAGTTSSHNVLA